MQLRKVISGGQSGIDQAGLIEARGAGLETGGWAPKGWKTEHGPAPWLADFGLREHPLESYPPRTEANARDSDGTLWIGAGDSAGFGCTANACRRHGKPLLKVVEGATTAKDVLDWLREHEVATLNVAGNRASRCAEEFLVRAQGFLRRVFGRAVEERGG